MIGVADILYKGFLIVLKIVLGDGAVLTLTGDAVEGDDGNVVAADFLVSDLNVLLARQRGDLEV